MAIYLSDGKMIEPNPTGTKLEKRLAKEFDEVKQLIGKFKLPDGSCAISLSREFRKIWDTTKTRYKPAPSMALPGNIGMYDPDLGTIEVRYASTPPTRTKNGISWGRESKLIVREGMTISDKQIDFAWFILKASDIVEKRILKIVDKQAEYEGSFKDMERQATVVSAIFDKNLTLETILEIAALVPTESPIGGSTREEVAMKLWTVVESGEKGKKDYNFDSVLSAIAKVKKVNGKASTDGKETVEVNLVNGEMLTVERFKCPIQNTMEKLLVKATELNFPTEGLDKDLIYSVIKHKLAEAGQKV